VVASCSIPGRQSPKPPEAIPRNERLNSPETALAVALEQGPEHTQEDTQEATREAGAAGTGARKARRPKQRNCSANGAWE